MKNQLVTIATFAFSTDPRLSLLAARLEHEGIASTAADAATIGIDPLLSPALGGVRVQVHPEDAERARVIYLSLEHSLEQSPELVPDFDELEWETEQQQNQQRSQRNFWLALLLLLIGIALFLLFL